MRTRRTKAQVQQDNYRKEVDSYNWFLLNLETNTLMTGFEFKADAKTEQIDNGSKGYTKVISKGQCKRFGIDIKNVLNSWKQSN